MNCLRLALAIGFIFFLTGGIFSAHAAVDTCGLNLLTTSACPIMNKDDDGNPKFKDIDIGSPIGKIKIPEKVYFFSGPLCIAESSVRIAMVSMYAIFSDAFLKPFTAALMLYVCFYAISFMYGLVNPKDFALRLLKIAIVYALVTDNCTFYNYLYGGFIGASNDLVRIMGEVNTPANATPPATGKDAQKQLYQSLDDLFNNVVGIDGMISLGMFLLSSLTSNGQGIPAGVLAALGFGSMALALMRALVTLGMAFAGITFFLLFTPIFLSFYLFETTKQMFDTWLSLLISFVLQPFIIFAFLVMMRMVIDSGPANLNINTALKDAISSIANYKYEPEMAQGLPTGNLFAPNFENPALMEEIGVTVVPGESRFEFQTKFYQHFVPKFLFWFVVNMIMLAFIKEVPNIAQRLSGFVSAPALGGESAFGGIAIPGVSRGAGGEVTSILKSAMGKNTAFRQLGVAGTVIAGGYIVKDMVDSKVRARDGNNIDNKAKDGEANRDGRGISRVGTLGELLGNKTTTREGMQAEGIGEKGAASREGPNILGVGDKDAAARTNPFFQRNSEKAREQEQIAANYYAGKGAEAMPKDLGIKAPKLVKNPTVIRNINIQVQDIKMTSRGGGTTTYMLNGKEIEVKKAEEEAFLRKQIAQIEKDIMKANSFGTQAQKEIALSAPLRHELQARLNVITSEQKAINALDKTANIISGNRTQLKTELKAAQEARAALDKQFNVLAKSKMAQDKKIEALKQLSLERALLQGEMDELAALLKADARTATAMREARNRLPELVDKGDIDGITNMKGFNFASTTAALKETQQNMQKFNVVLAEKQALDALELEAARLRTEGKANAEMSDLAMQVQAAAQLPNAAAGVAKLAVLSNNLKKRPDKDNLSKSIAAIDELQKTMEVVAAQRIETTNNVSALVEALPQATKPKEKAPTINLQKMTEPSPEKARETLYIMAIVTLEKQALDSLKAAADRRKLAADSEKDKGILSADDLLALQQQVHKATQIKDIEKSQSELDHIIARLQADPMARDNAFVIQDLQDLQKSMQVIDVMNKEIDQGESIAVNEVEDTDISELHLLPHLRKQGLDSKISMKFDSNEMELLTGADKTALDIQDGNELTAEIEEQRLAQQQEVEQEKLVQNDRTNLPEQEFNIDYATKNTVTIADNTASTTDDLVGMDVEKKSFFSDKDINKIAKNETDGEGEDSTSGGDGGGDGPKPPPRKNIA